MNRRCVIIFLVTWHAIFAILQATPLESEARAANDGSLVGPAAASAEAAAVLDRGAAGPPSADSAPTNGGGSFIMNKEIIADQDQGQEQPSRMVGRATADGGSGVVGAAVKRSGGLSTMGTTAGLASNKTKHALLQQGTLTSAFDALLRAPDGAAAGDKRGERSQVSVKSSFFPKNSF